MLAQGNDLVLYMFLAPGDDFGVRTSSSCRCGNSVPHKEPQRHDDTTKDKNSEVDFASSIRAAPAA